MRTWLVVAATVLLTACGGDGGGEAVGGGTPADAAAQACRDHAATQLEGKPFDLDLAVLAASMTDASDGAKFLKAPIVIEPKMSSETKQIVECTVRFTPGKDSPDIINFIFNW